MSFRIGEAFVEVTAEDNTQADTDGIGSRLTKWAAGLGLGALIGKSISDGMNIETGVANIQNQLGLTAQDAKTYGESAGRLYRGNFGESLDEVNGIIGVVGQSMGGLGTTTTGEIEKMTGQVMTLASTFDVDAAMSVAALDTAVSQGLAPSLQHATDVATRVFQEGGPKANEFLEIINEYAPNLANAGLSMEQFGSMSVAYLDAGGYSIDQFADSIREMTIRVADGSAESAGAFDTLGLNAEEMTAKMAAGGPQAQEAFSTIVAGLNGITDPVAQNTAGAQLFGSMWEDSSGAILAGLAPLPDQLGTVEGATQSMVDVAGGTGAAKIESMKRQLEGLLTGASELPGPLGAVGAAVGAVGIETIAATAGSAAMVAQFAIQHGSLITGAAAWVGRTAAMVASTAASGVATAAQWALNAAMSANPIALVVIAIAALVAGLVWFFTQTELGRQIITAVWNAIKVAIGATVDWITNTAVPGIVGAWNWVVDRVVWVKNMIVGAWSAITSWIANAVSSIYSTVTGWIGNVVGWLSSAWNGALNLVRSVWSGISGAVQNAIGFVVSIVRNLPGTILGVFSNAGSLLWNVGGDLIRGLWNGISNVTGWILGKIRGFVGSVTSGIKSFFGIGSPSKLFADEVGHWLPAGIADGIDHNLGVVTDAAEGMVDAAMPSTPTGVIDTGGMPGVDGDGIGLVSSAGNSHSVSIGNLTLQIEGSFDFSNPVEWDRFVEAVRAGLVKVEREYA